MNENNNVPNVVPSYTLQELSEITLEKILEDTKISEGTFLLDLEDIKNNNKPLFNLLHSLMNFKDKLDFSLLNENFSKHIFESLGLEINMFAPANGGNIQLLPSTKHKFIIKELYPKQQYLISKNSQDVVFQPSEIAGVSRVLKLYNIEIVRTNPDSFLVLTTEPEIKTLLAQQTHLASHKLKTYEMVNGK